MKKLFIVLGMLLSFTSTVFAQKPIAVFTFDIKGSAVSSAEAEAITELFISELVATGKVYVVDRANFDKVIEVEEMKFQSSDRSNSDKISQLGKALNANMVITGQLISFKGTLVATFRMLDVNTVEIIATVSERTSGTDELFSKLSSMAKKLTNNINSSSGSVESSYNIGE